MVKIGKRTLSWTVFIAMSAWLATSVSAWAAPRFSASPDATDISQDDSVSVKFRIETDSMTSVGELQYSAPDFELVHQYQSTSMSSVFGSGGLGFRNVHEITRVLRPKRTGSLLISGITVSVGGKNLVAPDFTIRVVAGGAATPPPKRYGGAGGLRGAGKRPRLEPFFVRAEIDKQRLVKGEQLVVSYYLYRSTRVFNIAVEKYPTLNGFLREDLEMPILGQRLDEDLVVLDGQQYYRGLMVRYAAYPLQEGKMPIDTMAVKAAFYLQQNGGGGLDDEDDIFRGFFFQRMAPQERSQRSEILHVEVEPLPREGRPASFTGGVGDFEVSSAVDKVQLRAHEAVTLTVKIEGKGNTTSIEDPKHEWPPGLELYESKGQARSGRGGVGEKVFEYLLIPRVPGQMKIPPLEYSFFDPKKRAYTTKQTQAVDIQVAPGDPAAAPQAPAAQAGAAAVPSSAAEPLGLLGPDDYHAPASAAWRTWFAFLPRLGWVGVALCLGVLAMLAYRKWRPKFVLPKRRGPGLEQLKAEAKRLAKGARVDEVRSLCDRIETEVFEMIDRHFGLGARALARETLRLELTEGRGVDSATWTKIEAVLEFLEAARFSNQDQGAASQLARQVGDLQMVEGRFAQLSQRRNLG